MIFSSGMDGNLHATVRFAATPAGIGEALAAAHAFAEASRLPPDTAAKLAIIVEELVANIVDHGGAPGTPVRLGLTPRDGGVAITLIDRGIAFDPRAHVAAARPPARGGGAGLRLIRAWTTIEEARRVDDANRLTLFLAGASPDPG